MLTQHNLVFHQKDLPGEVWLGTRLRSHWTQFSGLYVVKTLYLIRGGMAKGLTIWFCVMVPRIN